MAEGFSDRFCYDGGYYYFQSLLCVLIYGISQFLWPCQIRDILYYVNLNKPSH